jgi:hypothetical protein
MGLISSGIVMPTFLPWPIENVDQPVIIVSCDLNMYGEEHTIVVVCNKLVCDVQ